MIVLARLYLLGYAESADDGKCASMHGSQNVIAIPYSGKFSLGANFRVFRGSVGRRENKNRELLNRQRKYTILWRGARSVTRKLKPRKFLVKG